MMRLTTRKAETMENEKTKQMTQADWAKLGVQTMQYTTQGSVVNTGTGFAQDGPVVATGPRTGLFMVLDWNRRKKSSDSK